MLLWMEVYFDIIEDVNFCLKITNFEPYTSFCAMMSTKLMYDNFEK